MPEQWIEAQGADGTPVWILQTVVEEIPSLMIEVIPTFHLRATHYSGEVPTQATFQETYESIAEAKETAERLMKEAKHEFSDEA